ncbi:GNAT family N-acetyltransferase [Acholeplasma hippikon]|nr:GNAT family N-acetyltransferase [Acholeplasma hippikon]
MNIKLVRLNEKYKMHLFEMMDEWYQKEPKPIPSAIRKVDYHDFDNYIKHIDNANTNGLIPDTTYFCLDCDINKFVGAVNIRHDLNEALLMHGGHIGFGVRPSMRSKGYGKAMLKETLKKCQKLGIYRVLMTCDKENIASSKVIQSNGGILENELVFLDKIIQRFWIENKKENI